MILLMIYWSLISSEYFFSVNAIFKHLFAKKSKVYCSLADKLYLVVFYFWADLSRFSSE